MMTYLLALLAVYGRRERLAVQIRLPVLKLEHRLVLSPNHSSRRCSSLVAIFNCQLFPTMSREGEEVSRT